MKESNTLELARMAIRELSKKERALLISELLPKDNHGPVESRVLRPHEAARKLGVSKRAVFNWSREGILAKVKLPNRKRAIGFRLVDVERLINGEAIGRP